MKLKRESTLSNSESTLSELCQLKSWRQINVPFRDSRPFFQRKDNIESLTLFYLWIPILNYLEIYTF